MTAYRTPPKPRPCTGPTPRWRLWLARAAVAWPPVRGALAGLMTAAVLLAAAHVHVQHVQHQEQREAELSEAMARMERQIRDNDKAIRETARMMQDHMQVLRFFLDQESETPCD